MKIVDGNYIIFSSTGRRAYAHAGVIGLGKAMATIFYGYDGCVGEDLYPNDDSEGLTSAERRELAEYMIAAWEKVRDES